VKFYDLVSFGHWGDLFPTERHYVQIREYHWKSTCNVSFSFQFKRMLSRELSELTVASKDGQMSEYIARTFLGMAVQF